jgi:hypothetical protein
MHSGKDLMAYPPWDDSFFNSRRSLQPAFEAFPSDFRVSLLRLSVEAMFSSSDRDVATALLAPDYLTAVQKNDNEVIKRLRSAQRLLEKAEQGEEEPHELFHFAKQLGQPWLLSHKHKVSECRRDCPHTGSQVSF